MIYCNYSQANKLRGQTGRAATMKYLSVPQTAERWGISSRRIQILCNEERIPGAVKIGNRWAIPDDEPKPADARIKSGKYVKKPAENEN